MENHVFSELSLVIIVTAAVSLFMRVIRQPLILGYILAGLLVGPSFLGLIHSEELFQVFSSLGIALLLFIIGLGMNIEELRKLGKPVFAVAASTLLAVTMVGFSATSLLGFTKTEALIAGLALFFSSTIIIVKILTDKKEQNRLHGQIAIGVILVEDIIATFALLFVAAGAEGSFQASEIMFLLAKGLVLLGFLYFCSRHVLPKVSRLMAESQEMLFLFAISWGFGIATLFEISGFSLEVGALFGGVALATSPYVAEIASRLRPLRDFFVVIFFIFLGQSLTVENIGSALLPALVLSAIVIVMKPFIVTTVLGILGYTKRVSFKAGINLSQISEFSVVLVILAISNELVRNEIGAIITLVAIITIAVSTYLMHYDDRLYEMFDRIKFHMFEKEVVYRENRKASGYPIVLLGYHHGGHEFVKTFRQMHKRFLVVDYDPDVIELMEQQKVDYLYGDVTDRELLDEANVEKAKLVVSTISEHSTNVFLVNLVETINPGAVIICHADNLEEATELYDLGASYVMIPHYIGSEKIGSFIKRNGLNKTEFKRIREKHLSHLESHSPEG
ncbi:MAG TPA: cation:proton antiporter [Candidatus Saccharimonadales bacterium]|nr:cation:proton antiporter [Candidatus Saccharimonadales bacterium]